MKKKSEKIVKKNYDNFMTEKEKKYVEMVLSRNISKMERRMDYSAFFNFEDKGPIEVKKNEKKNIEKREKTEGETNIPIKEFFRETLVRTHKKSVKEPRFVADIKAPEDFSELAIKIKIEEIIDVLIKRKYFVTEEPNYLEVNSKEFLKNINSEEFKNYIKIEKFFSFLNRFFDIFTDIERKEVVVLLCTNSNSLLTTESFKLFINSNFMYFPSLQHHEIIQFLNNFYLNTPGIIIGFIMLHSNNLLEKVMYDRLIEDDGVNKLFLNCEEGYVWQFLALLIGCLDENNRRNMVFLLKEKIAEVVMSDNIERIRYLDVFLDSIGVSKSDLVPDIFILDKKKNKITLIEVGITSQDSLQIVETEKIRKYDLLANELGLIYKCSVEIIPYVMTWDGIVTKNSKLHLKRLKLPMNVQAYIQSIVLKKAFETISFDRRRRHDASIDVIMKSEMYGEPSHPLKQASREEDEEATAFEELTININEESDLEEETTVVKEVEEMDKNRKTILTQHFIK
ncbi:hypothetical protein CWI36_0601p0020 [Hamiltosporidium magnivora]|uniref:Uncharacterized protein n=3 Tax=Hamiltosporidium TaxID=1176354 RepID=A0A4Q9LCM7_9MICR|nr:hypothetical protein CWI36_0601p0020 [Hamiltosporidium magnivora]